jgi:hypothetical protein
MKIIRNTAIAIAMACITATSYAAIRANHVRAGNFSSATIAGVLVPLNASGATTISFNLPSTKKTVLTYSAECAVNAAAGDEDAYLDIDVIVNGVTLAPTAGNQDAFCSANGVAGFDHWIRNSITVSFTGVTGVNTVSILARGNAGATGLWVGDSALVLFD